MNPYPKRILTPPPADPVLYRRWHDHILCGGSPAALTTIGYYRLRGYSFPLYNNDSRQYRPGTDFSDILNLYHFDTELSGLLFSMATCIEVALRARLSDALPLTTMRSSSRIPQSSLTKSCSGRTCLPWLPRSQGQMMCSYGITSRTMTVRFLYGLRLKSCPSGSFPRPLKISRPEKAAPILFWPGIIATVLPVENW